MRWFSGPKADPLWPPASAASPEHGLCPPPLELARPLGMWNDAVVLQSLSSSLGNGMSWVGGSNVAEIEGCSKFFGSSSPPLLPTAGISRRRSNPGTGPVLMGSARPLDVARMQSEDTSLKRKRMNTKNHTRKRAIGSKKPKTTHPVKLPSPSSDESAPAQTQKMKAPAKKSQKLGDKISALQQLVSPFGKSDTASVLHEALLSIKFLHEQIQVLSTPYFGMKPSCRQKVVEQIRMPHSFVPSMCGDYEAEMVGLQSRGLCLVPVSSVTTELLSRATVDHYIPWRTGVTGVEFY